MEAAALLISYFIFIRFFYYSRYFCFRVKFQIIEISQLNKLTLIKNEYRNGMEIKYCDFCLKVIYIIDQFVKYKKMINIRDKSR